MKAKKIVESFKEYSDPIKDMGIGRTLESEFKKLEKSGYEFTDLDDPDIFWDNFDLDENKGTWSGRLIHPMTGYDGCFEYIDLHVTLTFKNNKFIVEQSGKRKGGEYPKWIQKQVEYGRMEYPCEPDDFDDFKTRGKAEILKDREEFLTLKDAMDYIGSESCLNFRG